MTEPEPISLLIASYLEPEHVKRIRAVSPRLAVEYHPEMLSKPRYPADHYSTDLIRTPSQEQHWLDLLAKADILFDFDHTHMDALPELAPKVRWVQTTSAGIGQTLKRFGYGDRMPHTKFTTASGVHARPLAEFVIMAVIMHYKQTLDVLENQRKKVWRRYAGSDLEGRTLGVLGLGHIGCEVVRMAHSMGMRVLGSNMTTPDESIDIYYPAESWREMLPQLDVLVVVVPHTPLTENMVGRDELSSLPEGAFLVNIGRGAVVDEQALIESLQGGHLSGAALDVFAEEPLPAASPLWDLPNVLVSPHSASTSERENERITDLFCDNLQRFLDGQPLRNVLDTQLLY